MNYQKIVETIVDRFSWGALVAIGWVAQLCTWHTRRYIN